MKLAVLGTGMVGQTLAAKLDALGHDVRLGTRDPAATLARTEPGAFGNPSPAAWAAAHPRIGVVTLADAAAHGEVVVNALAGAATLAGLEQAGADHLAGKVLIDVSNPLDFSRGMPPSLSVCNTDSLGEQVQRRFPAARVVKTLNTVNANLMVDPGALAGGDHTMFVCGDDGDARRQVAGWLREWFGWRDVVELGDITTARGPEMFLPLWLRTWGALGTASFSFKVVR
ncbi:MAG: NAD(P)-binding domain-containing protein [Kofleriaceae bacterium]|nr:NAD(P)-binding domain-containing protein [Kofleriaceae bacterium]MBE7454667.1 NAD(P)-binding domain-containing protein [Kofleriaceae bacterium]MCL4225841.1 NAD(P)-binding domain-containing protein [Myxococcales bacterium]